MRSSENVIPLLDSIKGDAKSTLDQQPFDDFLGLRARSFRELRLFIFHGVSGSGKSRCLDYLANQHNDFRDRDAIWIDPHSSWDGYEKLNQELVIVDEIRMSSQLALVNSLLRQGNTVGVASHLKPWLYWPLRCRWPTRCFRTDHSADKIARFLENAEVNFSKRAVGQFCSVFGANYLDVCHVLERFPGDSFDTALQKFLKFCDLKRQPESSLNGCN